jgi:hypothetical protein
VLQFVVANEPEKPRDNEQCDKNAASTLSYSPTVAAILAAQPLNPLTKAIVTWEVGAKKDAP